MLTYTHSHIKAQLHTRSFIENYCTYNRKIIDKFRVADFCCIQCKCQQLRFFMRSSYGCYGTTLGSLPINFLIILVKLQHK